MPRTWPGWPSRALALYGQRLWKNYRLVREHSVWEKKQQVQRNEQQEMDRILQKVHDKGVDSLSGSEKKFLSEATRPSRAPTRRAATPIKQSL